MMDALIRLDADMVVVVGTIMSVLSSGDVGKQIFTKDISIDTGLSVADAYRGLKVICLKGMAIQTGGDKFVLVSYEDN